MKHKLTKKELTKEEAFLKGNAIGEKLALNAAIRVADEMRSTCAEDVVWNAACECFKTKIGAMVRCTE